MEAYSPAVLDALFTQLETHLEATPLNTTVLNHLLALADDLSAQGDWERAWRALHIEERAAQQQHDARYLAEGAIHRGILHYRRGELRDAARAWENAREQFDALGESEGAANCDTNLGAVYKSLGELDRAEQSLQRAVNTYRAIGYQRGEAAALSNLGLIQKERGEIEHAQNSFQRVLEISRELQDRASEAAALGNLGLISLPMGDIPQTLAYTSTSKTESAFCRRPSLFSNAMAFIAVMGICAGAVYVLGFTILQEGVEDELRGRTFATLYTLSRLCMLISLSLAPLVSRVLDDVSNALVDGELSLGSADFSVPGVRITLWIGAAIILAAGALALRAQKAKEPN